MFVAWLFSAVMFSFACAQFYRAYRWKSNIDSRRINEYSGIIRDLRGRYFETCRELNQLRQVLRDRIYEYRVTRNTKPAKNPERVQYLLGAITAYSDAIDECNRAATRDAVPKNCLEIRDALYVMRAETLRKLPNRVRIGGTA